MISNSQLEKATKKVRKHFEKTCGDITRGREIISVARANGIKNPSTDILGGAIVTVHYIAHKAYSKGLPENIKAETIISIFKKAGVDCELVIKVKNGKVEQKKQQVQ